MTHQWLDPISGTQAQSDESPGDGWLGIVEVTLIDGSIVESTLPGAEAWLKAAGYNAIFNQSWLNVSVNFSTEADADVFESEVIPILSGCRYFVFNRDGADPTVWIITIDPDADSYDPDEYHVIATPDDAPDIGGGGGRPTPIDPDRPPLPFPGPGRPGTGPPVSPPIGPPIDPPADPPDDILKKAREAADKDAGSEPSQDDSKPNGEPGGEPGDGPPGHKPGGDEPCPNCEGTGKDPGDDEGDGGDGESDESGSGDPDTDIPPATPVQDAIDEAEKEDYLQDLEDEYLEALQEGDQDAIDDLVKKMEEHLEKEGTPGDEPGDCKECGGSGSGSPEPGDEEEDEGDSEDELPAVVYLANETIKKANQTIDDLIRGEGMDTLLLRARECNDLASKCEDVADPRSVTQREIIQRALDAAERATAAASRGVWEGQ